MPKIYPSPSLNSPVKRDDDNLWKRNLLNFIIRITFHKLPARQEKKTVVKQIAEHTGTE